MAKGKIEIPKPDPCKDFTRKDEKWYLAGEEVDADTAAALKKMAIPPAWTDVVVARDPSREMQAIGRDSSGKWQYRYSKEHEEKAKAEKFIRVQRFTERVSDIRKSYLNGIENNDIASWVLKIEDETAIRVGSVLKMDVAVEKRAYGLTTLTKEHVIITDDKVELNFIAKCAKHASYPIEDPKTKSYLIKRYSELKPGESLFPTIDAEKINDHLRKITGEYFKFHDFRAYHGSRMATEILSSYIGQELSAEEKSTLFNEVCSKVSEFLHNTPGVAYESYIDPKVWDMIGGDKDVTIKKPKKPKKEKKE